MKQLTFQGRVERGEGMATRLGCPTANIAVEQGVIIPGLGVYIAEAELEGKRYPAIACINDGRTGHNLKMEIHLLGMKIDLDGKFMCISLIEKMRGLIPFESEDVMAKLIKNDISEARNWFEDKGYEIRS